MVRESYPRGDEPEAVWERSIKAKALDAMRGLLPAASLSHVGIFASGQAYEQLVLRLFASPLPEAREVGEHGAGRAPAGDPGFVKRVDMPDRGGAWIEYLEQVRRARPRRPCVSASETARVTSPPAVQLLRADGSEEDLIAACLYEASDRRGRAARSRGRGWSPTSGRA